MTNNCLNKRDDFSEKFLAATGARENSVAESLLVLCGTACATTKESVKESFLSMVAAMKELAPQDLVEGMLATRFWALHTKGMSLLAGSECNINLAMKLLRLSSETLDTLLKWRRRGEQRVVVSHLNVSDGAVVGNIVAGGIGVKMEASTAAESMRGVI